MVACSPGVKEYSLNPREVNKTRSEYVNPFPVESHAHYVARKDYLETSTVYLDKSLTRLKGAKKQKVIICLQEQRGRYYVNDQIAMDFPVSTGIRSYPTKPGSYKITGKKEHHVSNLYGKMYDAEGKCINTDAKSSDPVPEGGEFVGAAMPYWMRLTGDGLGMHVGKVRRRPLSHGCIRLDRNSAEVLFKNLPVGTPVVVQQSPEVLPSLVVSSEAYKLAMEPDKKKDK